MNSYGDGNKYRGVGTTTLVTKEILSSSEPVAWMYVNDDGECEEIGHAIQHYKGMDMEYFTPLYTHPQKELTDEDIMSVAREYALVMRKDDAPLEVGFARAILKAAECIK